LFALNWLPRSGVLAALLVAPTAFAQSQGQDQPKSATEGYKPSGDTPAKQKQRNGDYSKIPRGRRITSWPSLKTDLKNAGADWVEPSTDFCNKIGRSNRISYRSPAQLPA
jgi:putative intracellular protease/amidase